MVRRRLAQQTGDWMDVECTRRLRADPEGSSASPCPRSRLRKQSASTTRHSSDREFSDPSTDPSIHRSVEFTQSHEFPARAFRSGHLHGRDGFVGLVLVGIEIDEPAGSLKEPPFGSSPRGTITHFDGAGAGGRFATFSGQRPEQAQSPPGPIASPCTKRRGRRTRPGPHRQASHRRPECGSNTGAAAPNPTGFRVAKNNRSKSACTLNQRKRLSNQAVWPVILRLTGPICARVPKL